MSLFENITTLERDDSSIITVGTFDGVHMGHRAIIDYLLSRAKRLSGRSTLVTFHPHPREIVGSGPVALLTSVEERARICRELGVDCVVVIPFTYEFSRLTPDEFVTGYLLNKIGMQEIVIGHDHGFGRNRKGDEHVLQRLAEKKGFAVDVIPAWIMDQHVVSSSEIRRLICEEGNVARAAEHLGTRFGLSGQVVRGLGRGKTLGFPTANLAPSDPRKLIPLNGVYAVRISIDDENDVYAGMMNIGHRPTFEDTGRYLEVHIIDFDENLYFSSIRIEFISRIRSERKFENEDMLVRQLYLDKERCIASFEETA